jgi:hypothetical protein
MLAQTTARDVYARGVRSQAATGSDPQTAFALAHVPTRVLRWPVGDHLNLPFRLFQPGPKGRPEPPPTPSGFLPTGSETLQCRANNSQIGP